jgi:hypothetical protein
MRYFLVLLSNTYLGDILLLSNAQSLDTPVLQGSTENMTGEPETNAAIVP